MSSLRTWMKRCANGFLRPTGLQVSRIRRTATVAPRVGRRRIYDQDGLTTHHNCEFMDALDFRKAYQRGVAAAGRDYQWHWRVHVGLWAAWSASRLDGDFVECGVNQGVLSSAIMEYLDWNRLGKTFYLLDTFAGLDERYVTDEEKADGVLTRMNGFYVFDCEEVRQNFAQWNKVRIIQGAVPDTLAEIDAEKVAYLHLDMNCSVPEVAAVEYLWDRLVPGAMILLDDYGFPLHESQKVAMDGFATRYRTKILSLPTGQGLIIR